MFPVNDQGVAVSETSYQLISKKMPLGTHDVGLPIDLNCLKTNVWIWQSLHQLSAIRRKMSCESLERRYPTNKEDVYHL